MAIGGGTGGAWEGEKVFCHNDTQVPSPLAMRLSQLRERVVGVLTLPFFFITLNARVE